MKNIRFFLFAFVWITQLVYLNGGYAQLLSESRQVNWSGAGYNRSYPSVDQILNIRDLGAKADGVSNDQPAIQAALDSLGGRRGIVYVPAGDYLLQAPINLPDSALIKGEGSTVSRLLFDLGENSGNCIQIEAPQQSEFVPITADAGKGDTRLYVLNEHQLQAGHFIEIRQENGDWDTQPATWANHSMGQLVQISSIEGGQLTLNQPLRADFVRSLQAEVRPLEMRHEVGIECLGIERVDHPVGGYGYNISMNFARNCWIRGIESNKSVGSHIFLNACTDITLERNLIYDAFEFDGGSTRGYGITLAHHTGQVLVQDNIFQRLRHAMMVKQGANGNVFAYNYSSGVVRSEFPNDFSGDISLHGHYAYANLFEGNVVQQIIIDHYWGPSGPHNTFFRNRAEGYGMLLGSLVAGIRLSDGQHFIANEVTHQLGFPGYFILMGQDHISVGNHLGDSILPERIDTMSVASLFREEKPDFWGEAPWPNIGIPVPYNSQLIPAQRRASSENEVSDCEELRWVTNGPPTDLEEAVHSMQWHVQALYPNPFREVLTLKIFSPQRTEIDISVWDVSGSILYRDVRTMPKGTNLQQIRPASNWAAGLYMIRLKTSDQEYILRVQHE